MTRTRKRKLARQVGMPFATALIAGAAQAADTAADEGQLEEVTVTAQKRTEDLQKVPISLQVLGGEKLEELQVSNFDDYAKFLPSVTYISLGPGQSTLYFRGVATGSDGLHAGAAPATGTYIDEIPITTIGGAPDLHVYDIQRVEALAGPQGTLYGASSLSGTMRIITNKPDASAFAAGYDVKADKFGHGNGGGTVEGFVNLPITDRIAVRLVGYYDYAGGFINNLNASNTYQRFAPDGDPTITPAGTACAPAVSGAGTTGTVCPLTVTNAGLAKERQNEVKSGGGRAALKIDLNDNWSILPQFIAQTQDAGGDFTVDTKLGDLNVADFRPTYDKDTWYQSALTVQGKISNWEVLYTGGWFQRKTDNQVDYSEYTVDYDAYAQAIGGNYTRANNNAGQLIDPTQYTRNRDRYTKANHEFRLNSPVEYPVRGTAGLFYERQSDDIRAEFRIDDLYVTNVTPPLDGSAPPGPTLQSVTNQPGVIYLSQMDRTDRDYAVFTDFTFDLGPAVHLSAGIRKFWVENTLYGFFGYPYYEVNTIRGCLQASGVAPLPIVTGNRPCVDTNHKIIENGETHRINLTWEIDADRMIYATYSTGFRPGGANRLTTAAPYTSDTLANFEFGWKTSWFDHHLRFNGAGFLEHWNNVQLATQGQYDITSIDNIGKATIKGAEAEIEWAAFSGLTVSFGGTYVDAKTTTDFCLPVHDTGQVVTDCSLTSVDTAKGSHLPVTPNFKGNASVRYNFTFADYKNFAQAVVVHQTSSTPDIEGITNALEGTIPGFTTADFSMGTGKDNWKLEAYIDNAFSQYGELSRLSECGAAYCKQNYRSYLIKPMNFGIKFGAEVLK